MSLLDLLKQGDVDGFNAKRSLRDRPDLFAADLAGAKLVGVDLSSANLSKADLTGADLTDATLVRADLSECDATGIVLTGALAIKARLRGAYMDQAVLDTVDLSRGDLTETVLEGSRGAGLRLASASLRRADCKGVQWAEVVLCEARMHKCDLSAADLTRADLTEAVATEVNLSGARLDGIIAVRANFAESDLSGATLVGADLREINLTGATLDGADLRNVDLTRANLSGASLAGCDLRDACLSGASLEGVDLSSVDLQGADLSGHDPELLGLSDERTALLSAWGAPEVDEAPLVVSEPAVARYGDHVAILWLNPDTDTLSTLRWGLIGPDGARSGVLTLAAEGVLARMVAPTYQGFELVVILDRPGGTVLYRVLLNIDGTLGVPATTDLRYTPAVAPVLTWNKEGLRLIGMSRRGSAVVVQALTDDGTELLSSGSVPTATGFWSTNSPVLATRGGVLIGVVNDTLQAPTRTPAGFPGRAARVVLTADGPVAAWFEPSDEPGERGWLRWAVLGGRGEPTVRTVQRVLNVQSLDLAVGPRGVHIAWVESQDPLVSFTYSAVLPGTDPRLLQAAGDAAAEVRWARGPERQTPALVITTLQERVIVVSGSEVLGTLGGEP